MYVHGYIFSSHIFFHSRLHDHDTGPRFLKKRNYHAFGMMMIEMDLLLCFVKKGRQVGRHRQRQFTQSQDKDE